MAVRKITVSMEPALAETVAAEAAAAGTSVSAWLADEARARARREAAREALEAFESEHGPLTPEE